MDKESSVGTQYIICECGDNFPNEKFLNIHLANDHANVETFICNVCPASFTSKKTLLQHKRTHESETPMTPELKTYARKTPTKQNEATVQIKTQKQQPQIALKTYMMQKRTPQIMQTTEIMQKKPPQVPPKTEIVQIKPQTEKKTNVAQKNPPVIKVQNLKRINSISLIQSLKSYGGFIKIEPSVEPPAEIEVPVEEPRQVPVKNEAQPETEETTEEIYYQCDVCNSIFYTEAEFNVHYQSTHAMKQEPTPEQILEDHLVTDHGDDVGVKAEVETAYYFECEICHKIFASEKYFNIHYNKVHGGLLPLDAAQEHMDEDTQEEEAALSEATQAATEDFGAEPKHKAPEQVVYYKCDLCKILYPSEKAYNTHFDKKHGQSCPEMTGFQFIEQQLTEECSPMPEPEFHCEFCPKSFSLKRSLQVHRKRAHLQEVLATAPASHARAANRSKVCDICGRAYNSNAALRYHQRRHTGEKPYPCTVCPKRFTMPMFLQIHMRTHTGEKPYECPHCPKAFTNKAALIRHDRVHTGVKPYPCPECGKFFTQSNSMKLHVSTVHLKLPAPYKSARRRSKSEARALQLALKAADSEELVLGE